MLKMYFFNYSISINLAKNNKDDALKNNNQNNALKNNNKNDVLKNDLKDDKLAVIIINDENFTVFKMINFN